MAHCEGKTSNYIWQTSHCTLHTAQGTVHNPCSTGHTTSSTGPNVHCFIHTTQGTLHRARSLCLFNGDHLHVRPSCSCCTASFSTPLHCTALHCAPNVLLLHYIILQTTTLYYSLYLITLNKTIKLRNKLQYIALHCISLRSLRTTKLP